jgi:UDP-N-acetylmuramoyl-tripeptide--D-alanyl-D-alanine ligase
MIAAIISMYSLKYPNVLIYMLQNTEYRAGPYLAWYWRTQNFSTVMYRRKLERTKAARLLLLSLRVGMLLQVIAGLTLLALWYWRNLIGGWEFGLALLLSYPIVWAHLACLPLALGRWFVVVPHERRSIKRSAQAFADHAGVKIAVAGSYGKTSMKEILRTVLSEGKKVAATPANKNVATSHAHFAKNLDGDEDVLVIEYGEGAPGDVAKFAKTTHPTHAVITGLAPAHLDRYKTVERAGKDIFSVADYLDGQNVYVNAESTYVKEFMKDTYHPYSAKGALGWSVKNINLDTTSTSFTMKKGKQEIELTTGLLGSHQIGPLVLAAALGLELGLTEEQVKAGVSKTVPFEHRMQPYELSGAWVIDDTYNGNIEGIRVGLELLKALKGTRKLYVTPGLVDQGRETKRIHQQIGELIAEAEPDIVVLMQNSVAPYIRSGLAAGKYAGELRVETDPLEFYTNLKHFVAGGDVVLLQNDWPDNYA